MAMNNVATICLNSGAEIPVVGIANTVDIMDNDGILRKAKIGEALVPYLGEEAQWCSGFKFIRNHCREIDQEDYTPLSERITPETLVWHPKDNYPNIDSIVAQATGPVQILVMDNGGIGLVQPFDILEYDPAQQPKILKITSVIGETLRIPWEDFQASVDYAQTAVEKGLSGTNYGAIETRANRVVRRILIVVKEAFINLDSHGNVFTSQDMLEWTHCSRIPPVPPELQPTVICKWHQWKKHNRVIKVENSGLFGESMHDRIDKCSKRVFVNNRPFVIVTHSDQLTVHCTESHTDRMAEPGEILGLRIGGDYTVDRRNLLRFLERQLNDSEKLQVLDKIDLDTLVWNPSTNTPHISIFFNKATKPVRILVLDDNHRGLVKPFDLLEFNPESKTDKVKVTNTQGHSFFVPLRKFTAAAVCAAELVKEGEANPDRININPSVNLRETIVNEYVRQILEVTTGADVHICRNTGWVFTMDLSDDSCPDDEHQVENLIIPGEYREAVQSKIMSFGDFTDNDISTGETMQTIVEQHVKTVEVRGKKFNIVIDDNCPLVKCDLANTIRRPKPGELIVPGVSEEDDWHLDDYSVSNMVDLATNGLKKAHLHYITNEPQVWHPNTNTPDLRKLAAEAVHPLVLTVLADTTCGLTKPFDVIILNPKGVTPRVTVHGLKGHHLDFKEQAFFDAVEDAASEVYNRRHQSTADRLVRRMMEGITDQHIHVNSNGEITTSTDGETWKTCSLSIPFEYFYETLHGYGRVAHEFKKLSFVHPHLSPDKVATGCALLGLPFGRSAGMLEKLYTGPLSHRPMEIGAGDVSKDVVCNVHPANGIAILDNSFSPVTVTLPDLEIDPVDVLRGMIDEMESSQETLGELLAVFNKSLTHLLTKMAVEGKADPKVEKRIKWLLRIISETHWKERTKALANYKKGLIKLKHEHLTTVQDPHSAQLGTLNALGKQLDDLF